MAKLEVELIRLKATDPELYEEVRTALDHMVYAWIDSLSCMWVHAEHGTKKLCIQSPPVRREIEVRDGLKFGSLACAPKYPSGTTFTTSASGHTADAYSYIHMYDSLVDKLTAAEKKP